MKRFMARARIIASPKSVVLAAILAGFAANLSAAEMKAIELAVETHANAALLPSGPASSLVVTPCKGCSPLTLPATANTRYFVGRELVSLEELKRRLAGRPTAMLTVLYLKDSRELSRVIASAP
jgi:hypothetical protein